MLDTTGRKNHNFTLKSLSDDYREYAEENLITEKQDVIYAREDYGGDVIIVTMNKEWHKLCIYRLFKVGEAIQFSGDVELTIFDRQFAHG